MKRPGFRYRDEWLPNDCQSRQLPSGNFVRISRCGTTTILSGSEDSQLREIFMTEELFGKLERTGHIVTSGNAIHVLEALKKWHERTYLGPELHIVVTTTRCNLDCEYCHMNPQPVSKAPASTDLQPDTARAIVRFAMSSPNPKLTFEFQGGEPFLNFEAVQTVVEEARRQNRTAAKDLRFTLVSNLMVARDDQLAYCSDHGIQLSYTLNGPQIVHDHFRRTRSGAGSFLVVRNRLDEIRSRFPELLSPSPLCVIDLAVAENLEEIIDFFYNEGFPSLSLLRLKPLGNAIHRTQPIRAREFMAHYVRGLDYILSKNQAIGSRSFSERMVRVAMQKIVGDSNVGFVDWRNPCGDVSGAITYDWDGEILPADEARSMREEFALGNVRNSTYEELISRRETFRTMNLSLRDRDSVCRECAYNPYCGVMPVLEYARTGSAIPVPHGSEDCLFTLAVLDWVFAHLEAHPLAVFKMAGVTESELAAGAG